MSSCRGLVCLLVLLGVALAFGKPCQYITKDMKDTVKSIADELPKHPDIGTNPLFDSVLRSINNSYQRQAEMQLMNATLNVYTRIFSNILKHKHHHHQDMTKKSGLLDQLATTKRSEVISALEELRIKMEIVKSHLNRQNHIPLEDVYSTLNNIKVDDPQVQRRALAEFLKVYQVASEIADHKC